jgi:predicted acetyltransferase
VSNHHLPNRQTCVAPRDGIHANARGVPVWPSTVRSSNQIGYDMSNLVIRTIDPEELKGWLAVQEVTFGLPIDDEAVKRAASEAEYDRVFAAFDGSQIVATAQASSFMLTVPGGTVPIAGLGSAAVLPSHRRRGILAELTRQRFDQARELGEAVAAIWASEAIKRGRWQYGCATIGCEWELAYPYTSFSTQVDPRGRGSMLDRDDALPAVSEIYDKVRSGVPGMIDRSRSRWNNWLDIDPWHWRGDRWKKDVSPRLFAVWENRRGYVVYRLQRRWVGDAAEYRALVAEFMALDLQSYVGLWTWCFELDLVRSIAATQRPVDEVLSLLLVDPRRLQLRQTDALRIRPLDVPRALEARTFACDGSLTIEIVDAAGPWAGGRYRLSVDSGHATCTAVRSSPDVVIPADVLGSMYLGGANVLRLARAGLLSEHSPGSTAKLDRMLRSDIAPWCTMVF